MDNIPKEYRERFAKAAKYVSAEGVYKTQKEWENKGFLDFKRKVLGLCRGQSIKSLDELAGLLTDMGVVGSVQEGKTFIKELYGKRVYYGDYGNVFLEFTKVQNKKGQEACRISRFTDFD